MKRLFIGNLIKEVTTAINPREIRWSLTHMRVLCKPDRLVFTGTNGIKLIEKTYPVEINWDKEILVPVVLAKGYADLLWYGTKDIKNNLAPMSLHHDLIRKDHPEPHFLYPNYEPLFRFSHRKGNIRRIIDRQAALQFLKAAVPSMDRTDNRRLTLTQLGWPIDKDVNGLLLFEMLKALHSDKFVVRSDPRHFYVTFIGENERALLTTVKRMA